MYFTRLVTKITLAIRRVSFGSGQQSSLTYSSFRKNRELADFSFGIRCMPCAQEDEGAAHVLFSESTFLVRLLRGSL